MSGLGLKAPTLFRYFHQVEMLEQAHGLTKKYPKKVVKHVKKVQDLERMWYQYDCIVLFWGLCYLNEQERWNLLDFCRFALKNDGFLLLVEPVLKKGVE